MCLFAVAMGLSRAIYGMVGEKIDLKKFILASGALGLGVLSGNGALRGAALCPKASMKNTAVDFLQIHSGIFMGN